MATVSPTFTFLPAARHSAQVIAVSWTPITNGDTCDFAECSDFADRSVQVTGTFGGATLSIQGSNDGSNWVNLTDPFNNAISLTGAGLRAIVELTRYIRPVLAGGAASSLTVSLLGKR